jgi:DNA-binding CsgD family transcriptional regulator
LRRLGVTDLPRRPHRSTGANPAGLTDRELEVAALLAGNMSNADIAARLHISPRTAGHHVGAVLAKLGVDHRHDVADAAEKIGITPTGTADYRAGRRSRR